MADKYDVVVVGAGPAGASVARAAAEAGASTILVEEHPAVGLPRHCMGKLHGSSFTRGIVESLDQRVILARCTARRFYSPSRELLETPMPPESAYLVQRDEFDRELVRQAVAAGARVALSTRVTGLLRENGRARGVTTASARAAVIHGDVVIVTQGCQSRRTGIPMQESLSFTDESFPSGVVLDLVGVHDIEPGILELHFTGADTRGFTNIYPRDRRSCLISLPSREAFDEIRAGYSPLSRKIKDAAVIQMWGYVFGTKSGVPFPRMVGDGFILAGDSAGFNDMLHAIVSGRCAGQAAVQALRDGDVSRASLGRYEDACRKIGLHLYDVAWDPLKKVRGLKDDAIEALLPGMLARGEVAYHDVWPF